jgi:hypothetical protein
MAVLRVCGLVEGTYTVAVENPSGYSVIELLVNGVPQGIQPVYSFFWAPGTA